MYVDDYFFRFYSADVISGVRLAPAPTLDPYLRQGGQILLISLSYFFPDHELPVRLIQLGFHLLVFILFISLVWRLTEDRLAAALSGLIFGFCAPAYEAWLWFATIHNVLGCILALGMMHLWLSAIKKPHLLSWQHTGALLLFALLPLFYEQQMVVLGILPLMLLAKRELLFSSLVRRCLPLIAAGFALAGAFGCFLWRHSWMLQKRLPSDGQTLTLLDRLEKVGTAVRSALFGGELVAYREAFLYGLHQVLSQSFALWLLLELLLLALVLLFVTLFRPHESVSIETERRIFPMFAAGIAWALLALIPSLASATTESLPSRVLYLPLMGLSLSGGLLFAYGVRKLRFSSLRMACVLIPILLLLFSSIAMTGYARLYATRAERDHAMLNKVKTAFPSPPENAVFLPMALPYASHSAQTAFAPMLERRFTSALSVNWLSRELMQMSYHRTDLNALTENPWDKYRFGAIDPGTSERSPTVTVNDLSIPIDRVIPYTIQDEKVIGVLPLILVDESDHSAISIPAPFIAEYAQRGLPTLEIRRWMNAPAKH